MNRVITVFGVLLLIAASAWSQPAIQDLSLLVGKQVVVQRGSGIPTVLCQPGTYNPVMSYVGKTATVLTVTPKRIPNATQSMANRMPKGQMRELMEGKGAIILLRFEDGTELDSCAAVTPTTMSDFVALVPGQTLEPAPRPTTTEPSTAATLAPVQTPASSPTKPQECPVLITSVSSGNSFKADMVTYLTTMGNQTREENSSIGRSFLTVKYQNNSNHEVTGIRFRVTYFNSVQEVQHVSDVITPTGAKLKPKKGFTVVQSDWVSVGREKMQLAGWVDKVVFADGTSWIDDGTHACKATSKR